jgi:Protein of unknown function (DUF3631)
VVAGQRRCAWRPNGPILTSAEVQKLLSADQESEWADFDGRGPITKRQIALLLDPYGIHPDYVHPHGGRKTERAYNVEWFATAFRHYLGAPWSNRATVRGEPPSEIWPFQDRS